MLIPEYYYFIFQNGGRFYKDWNVTISETGAIMLSSYFSCRIRNTVLFDKTFVYLLVVEIIGRKDILAGQIDAKKKQFAFDIFKRRVQNDKEREKKFKNYFDEKVKEIKIKYSSTGNTKNSIFTQMRNT